MNRLIVAFLAAFDALLAAAGGLVLALAPLTLLWVFGFGSGADWGALWPVSATLWQFGHLVPVSVALPDDYLAVTGIDPAAAGFTLSLAPLAFAVFTAAFAARSGSRAAAAGEPVTGLVSGVVVFAALATGVALTGELGTVASVELWQAIVLPTAVYAVPALLGAVVGSWRHDIPPLARLRARVARLPHAWALVPDLVGRGTGIAVAGVVGVAGLVLGVTVVVRGPQIVALFQAGNVDLLGAIVLAVSQLMYLPTLLVWAMSFVAGPGIALGEGGAVSPSGTQTGVLPGIPVLGVIPESTSPWMLLLALLPVAVGVLTGWMLRARLARAGLDDALAPRVVVTAGVAALTAGFAALVAACAGGSIGPGRLATTGPEPGAVALAVGAEVLVGAAILLLSPRRAAVSDAAGDPEREPTALAPVFVPAEPVADAVIAPDRADTVPIDDRPAPADDHPSPDEQETAPIVGFERGSGRITPPDADRDRSVD